MAYLRDKDYDSLIQAENLSQILSNDAVIKASCANIAQAEAISYLSQKYSVKEEFTETLPFNNSAIYNAGDRVELNFPAYNPLLTYSLNSLITFSGKAYKNTTAITVPEAFNTTKWFFIGNQYDIYFVTYPAPLFDYRAFWAVGKDVFWRNKVYTNKVQTNPISHYSALQSGLLENIGSINVFPDDPQNGLAYWGTGTAYTLLAGTLPSDATKWTLGDNRNPQMVMILIDIALFHMHSRISPRNIPQLRKDRYEGALEWLKMVAHGEITATLPILQPLRGNRIRWGGRVKNDNSY